MNKILTTFTLLSLLLTACNSTPTARTTSTETTTTIENALCSEPTSAAPHIPAGDVQALAQTDKTDGEAYTFAQNNGAEIIPVDNGVSFAVWWQPEGFDITKDTVVVSLHGHGSWATRDFEVWYPELSQRKVAYLGLQWWFGRSLEDEGYYNPDRIYSLISQELAAKGVPPGNVIFEGFSMGGARSYGVSLYDQLCGDKYFGVNIANSGPWENDYPLYAQILSGTYGDKPFDDTRWILFCGEKDINEHPSTPELANVCTGMTATQTTLTSLGATVDLFIKDPTGDHGSFMRNADNFNQGMDEAEKILKNS